MTSHSEMNDLHPLSAEGIEGDSVLITAGRYANESGIIFTVSPGGALVEVLISSPKHDGRLVCVRRASVR